MASTVIYREGSFLKSPPKQGQGEWVVMSAEVPTDDERGGDIVRVAGMDVEQDLPLQAQHLRYAPDGSPTTIGKVRETVDSMIDWKGQQVPAKLARFEFAPTELANKYKALWPEYLNKVSIGARVKKAEPINKKEPWGGMDYLKTEVFELSIVTIPANPSAQALRAIHNALGDQFDASTEGSLKTMTNIFEAISTLQKDLGTSQAALAELTKLLTGRLDDIESLIVAKPEVAGQASDPQPATDEMKRLADTFRSFSEALRR